MRQLLPLILLACGTSTAPTKQPGQPTPPSSTPEAPAPAQVTPDPAPENPPDRRFVLGSSLNLRAEPKGKVLGKLSINSPVTELETKDGWTRVKVGNGKEGWVGSEFLGTEVVTVAAAVARAKESGELSWWQRAAAIAPERDVLEGLEAAYRAAGETALADQVQRQLRWPRQLLLAWQPWEDLPAGQSVVEWSRAGYGEELKRTVPRAAWRRYGLEEGDVWWVLPSRGAAVPAEATRLSQDPLNECSGEWSRNVWLKHEPFAEGVVAVAAWRGRPPESWSSRNEPKVPRKQAEAEVRAQLPLKGEGEVTVVLGPSGRGWVGFARVENGDFGELGNELYDEVEVRWAPAPDGITIGEVQVTSGIRKVVTQRDVLGSGKPITVRDDGCATYALDAEDQLNATLYRCCGC